MRFLRRKPKPFPQKWRELLRQRLAHYAALPDDLRQRFEQRVQEFISKKRFYGCNDLEVSEDMQVLIAGTACLLILRVDDEVYPNLRSVLVYPTAFWVRHDEPDELGLVHDGEDLQLGESQEWGRVILSWQDVELALEGDPINVAAHEFAHQLDVGDGAPGLPDYSRWSKVMQAAYDELVENGSHVLDDYGTEGPAEFFAVATEAYLQSGPALRRHHAELYELLRDYYLLDTAGN